MKVAVIVVPLRGRPPTNTKRCWSTGADITNRTIGIYPLSVRRGPNEAHNPTPDRMNQGSSSGAVGVRSGAAPNGRAGPIDGGAFIGNSLPVDAGAITGRGH